MKRLESNRRHKAALAHYFGVSVQRVSQLIGEGVVIREPAGAGVMLADSIRNYYLNKATLGSLKENSYQEEKRLHEKAKRQLAELKLAKALGKVYEADVVEKALIELLTNVRTNLYNIIPRIKPLIKECDETEIEVALQTEIENVLAELAEFDSSKFYMAEGDEE